MDGIGSPTSYKDTSGRGDTFNKCKSAEYYHKYSKSVCVCVVSRFSNWVYANNGPLDHQAVCFERHSNLYLCMRLVEVNGTVHNKRMSTSLQHSHGLKPPNVCIVGYRKMMSCLEKCPLEQLPCLNELHLFTRPSLFVTENPQAGHG